MSKKITHNDFLNKVKDLVGNEYTVLSEYKNSREKIHMRHNKCGFEYYVSPNKFTNPPYRRCPKCNGGSRKSQEEWESEVFDLGKNDYISLTPYKNNRTHVLMKHKTCGHEWYISPSNFIKGHRCPKCADKSTSEKLALNPELYKKRFYDKANNEYELLTDYKRSNIKVKIKHLKCGHEFLMNPGNFLKGHGCPNCSPKSYGELRIANYLKNNGYVFQKEYSFNDLVYEKNYVLILLFLIITKTLLL